jgi:hypothetical protein
MKASPRSSMIALRSRMPSVTISSAHAASCTPLSQNSFGVTPTTFPAGGAARVGEDAHVADVVSAVNELPVFAGDGFSELRRGIVENLGELVARGGVNGDGADRVHGWASTRRGKKVQTDRRRAGYDLPGG